MALLRISTLRVRVFGSDASRAMALTHRFASNRLLLASNQVSQSGFLRTYNYRAGSSPPKANSKDLDPDKIKGPGGLTMTQIGKLVKESRTRDLEHMAHKQQQRPQQPPLSGSRK